MTTLTATRSADALARLDAGTATTRIVTPAEATDRDSVLLTDEGLAVTYNPDRRFPGEPYRDDDGNHYSSTYLGTLRVVDLGGEGGIGR